MQDSDVFNDGQLQQRHLIIELERLSSYNCQMKLGQDIPPVESTPLICYLELIFNGRKSRNLSYSLRAFARDLGLSAGKLSEILSGKYSPGPTVLRRIGDSLNLNPQEMQHLESLAKHHETKLSEISGARVLQEDEFALLVDKDYYSLMSLLETDNCRFDIPWISARLGIPVEKVPEILDSLIRLNLVTFSESKFLLTHKNITTTHNVPSEDLKQAHRQLIDHARACIDDVSVEERDITSITFAIDRKRLDEAKKILRECRRKLADLFVDGEKNEVYNLNMQLVPVTKNIGDTL